MPVPLHELSASQALARMRAGRLSAVDLLEALLEQIDAQDPVLKAWVAIDREGALRSARAADRAWKKGAAGRLCGIPVSVKDLIFTRGMPTTANFAPYRGRDPGVDAACIARLRAAGAVVLGKVQTTQFAGRDPSPTRNPWHLSRSASGSSSGSAVSVAARMVPVSVATQTGGSIIRPAAYMGVVGFSPTYGRISRSGLIGRSFSFDTIGTMGRSVDDAELLFSAMTGPDPADASTLLQRDFKRSRAIPGRPPRLRLVEDYLVRVTPETRQRFEASLARLEAAGARVERAPLPVPLELIIAIHTTILLSEAAASQIALLPRHREHYAAGLRAQLEVGNVIPAAAYIHAQRVRRRARARLAKLLSGADALVLPSMPDGAPDRTTIGPLICQVPWTIMGWPGITLPAGLNSAGLPLGIQLVTGAFEETRLFSVARWMERQLDPMPAPPSPARPAEPARAS